MTDTGNETGHDPDPATSREPTRRTWKEHGRPAQLMYYGYGQRCQDVGRPARAELVRHEYRYHDKHRAYTTVDLTWERPGGAGEHTLSLPPALAFWAAPIDPTPRLEDE